MRCYFVRKSQFLLIIWPAHPHSDQFNDGPYKKNKKANKYSIFSRKAPKERNQLKILRKREITQGRNTSEIEKLTKCSQLTYPSSIRNKNQIKQLQNVRILLKRSDRRPSSKSECQRDQSISRISEYINPDIQVR